MKILGLDSSGIVASVAIVEEDNLIAEYTVNYKKTHSQTLLPMLDELAKMTELDMDTIDAIAVAAGPGSFTGLRIGSATAKGLGLALKKPLVEIPTVDALAYNLYDAKALICPIMDARRSQVYTGIYRFEDHKLVTVEAQMAVPMMEMIDKLNERGEEVIFLGDGSCFCENDPGESEGALFLRTCTCEQAESRSSRSSWRTLRERGQGGNGHGACAGIFKGFPG